MLKTTPLFAGLTVALASWLSTPASAAPSVAYLSRAGSGIACTLTAPCASMATALVIAGVAGEVVCLDKSDYQSAVINQSVTISCGDGLWEAPDHGVAINTPAGSSVFIEGLVEDGNGTPATAFTFQGSGTLTLRHVRIGNNIGANSDALLFQPSGAGKLQVTDSVFYTNGGSGSGGGIVIKPKPGGTAQVELERVTVTGNAFGIAADGTGSTGGINMTIADSVVANNANDGILATTQAGGAPIGVMVKNTKSANNDFGLRALGPNITIRASNSTITGNDTGLAFVGGGALLTFGNNEVQANGSNGAFSGQVGQQ